MNDPLEITEAEAIEVASSHDDWIADRRGHITGTDIAAIFGLSKFRTPMDIWLEKRHEAPEQEVNDQMKWGNRLERGILLGYQEETGIPLTFADPHKLIVAPEFPLLGATLDARHKGGDFRPVDAKNVGRAQSADWGDSETDNIPMYYALQLHVQMIVTGTQLADLAALLWGSDFRRYTVHADADITATIKTESEAWWKRHIINGECPPIDGSKSTADYLARKFAKNTEALLPSNSEVDTIAVSLREVRKSLEEQEAIKDAYQNQLKALIGDAAGITGEWGKVTWKKIKDGEKVNWEALANSLGATAEQVKQFTERTHGYRRFLPKFKEEGE
jgi:putative phage-type endonuclease